MICNSFVNTKLNGQTKLFGKYLREHIQSNLKYTSLTLRQLHKSRGEKTETYT